MRWGRRLARQLGELAITHERNGRRLYYNAFVTSTLISDATVTVIFAASRTRWQVENEGNNIPKTKGYHFEYNFGRGQQHLVVLLLASIPSAFLCVTPSSTCCIFNTIAFVALWPRGTCS
jgi:hypothetical protein